MGKFNTWLLLIVAAGCAGEPDESTLAEPHAKDLRDIQASVKYVGPLSEGRAGVEVSLMLPGRGNALRYNCAETWKAGEKTLLLTIHSLKGDGDGPVELYPVVMEIEAPDHALEVPGEWTLRFAYSLGGLADDPARQRKQTPTTTKFTLKRS